MRILYLDDDPYRHATFAYTADRARTAQEAIRLLKESPFPYDLVSLDHDLADEHYASFHKGEMPVDSTGYDVACYIEQMPEHLLPRWVNTHSFNPAGRARIMAAVRNRVPKVTDLMTLALCRALSGLDAEAV